MVLGISITKNEMKRLITLYNKPPEKLSEKEWQRMLRLEHKSFMTSPQVWGKMLEESRKAKLKRAKLKRIGV